MQFYEHEDSLSDLWIFSFSILTTDLLTKSFSTNTEARLTTAFPVCLTGETESKEGS